MSFQNIHFIDKDDHKMFNFAFKEFYQKKIIGFDLEEYWGQ